MFNREFTKLLVLWLSYLDELGAMPSRSYSSRALCTRWMTSSCSRVTVGLFRPVCTDSAGSSFESAMPSPTASCSIRSMMPAKRVYKYRPLKQSLILCINCYYRETNFKELQSLYDTKLVHLKRF